MRRIALGTNVHSFRTSLSKARGPFYSLGVSLLILATGCSTARQAVTNDSAARPISDTHDSQILANIGDAVDSHRSVVQTVGHQIDTADSTNEPSVDGIQLAAPMELAPIPTPSKVEADNGLTLAAIEQLALANNPAIQQAAAAAARAQGIRIQVGLKPNPIVGYNGAQLADAGTDQHSFFVEQTFVRGDKLAWNQQVIGHDVNAMNWLVETQRQRLRTDIRLAFYEALAAQQRLELSREFRDVALKGVTVSEDRVKASVGAKPDVLQSEIQLSEIDLAIQQAEFDYSAAWNELAALAGIPDMAQSELVGELNSVEQLRETDTEYAQIVARSPLLSAAQARVDRARSNLQRQQNQPISNVTGQLGAGHDNGTGQGFINLQLSMPVPVHNKNQGNIQAAHSEYCEAIRNVERIQMSIRRDLARVMREYQVADATVQRYEKVILPKAREAMDLMQSARDSGEFDFLRVLTTRRAFYDANIKYVVALGQLAQANAKLDGLLLSGGLTEIETYDGDDSLRGQALSGQ
ncbi:TolC family protein [Thalassoglobus polymorphus]|uniref:TolC family protein n=1 Tax=Thalassoglobus polymorphus TaxID=2527994 RepID=UPI001E4BFD04|nr:TolC family protein [Thalassoglobus polymorphus]